MLLVAILAGCRVPPPPPSSEDTAGVDSGDTAADDSGDTAAGCGTLELAAGGTIYADQAAAPGGNGTAACPVATLDAAQALVREWRERAAGDLTVAIGAGRWTLHDTLRFGPEDSGPPGYRVIWTAAEPGKVELAAGIPLRDWTLDSATGLWSAAVTERVDELYVAGNAIPRARIQALEVGLFPYDGEAWTALDQDPADWLDGAELAVVAYTDAGATHCPVERIEGTRLYPSAACVAMVNAWTEPEDLVFDRIVGARAFLDTDREYVYDPAGRVYYRAAADEDPNASGAETARLTTLIELQGRDGEPVERLSLRGLRLRANAWSGPFVAPGMVSGTGTWYHPDTDTSDQAWERLVRPPAALEVHGAQDVELDALWFDGLGSGGLAIDGGSRAVQVTRSLFAWTDGVPLVIGDVATHHLEDPAQATGDIQVVGNRLYWSGAELQDAPGVLVTYANGVSVTDNTFRTTSLAAVQLGWGFGLVDAGGNPTWDAPAAWDSATVVADNVVLRNRFENSSNELPRGGAVRVIGAQPGARIAENVIVEPDDQRLPWAGVLLDHGARHVEVSRNVFSTPGAALRIEDTGPDGSCGNARDNRFSGNWGSGALVYACADNEVAALAPVDAEAEAVDAAAGDLDTDVWWWSYAQGMP